MFLVSKFLAVDTLWHEAKERAILREELLVRFQDKASLPHIVYKHFI